MKARFGYHTPDVHYEATVAKLVESTTSWLDLGCGSDLFPSNLPTSKRLAQTAKLLVGVDPSDNVLHNTLVHARFHGLLQDYKSTERFDLFTMRMVAEHIAEPQELISHIARLTAAGGHVVIYTVSLWSPVTIISALTPLALHHRIKAILWRTEERDTFPVVYKMNTRAQLRDLFAPHGFEERCFSVLADCRSLGRWRLTHWLELALWKVLRAVGLPYPENCILAVYCKKA